MKARGRHDADNDVPSHTSPPSERSGPSAGSWRSQSQGSPPQPSSRRSRRDLVTGKRLVAHYHEQAAGPGAEHHRLKRQAGMHLLHADRRVLGMDLDAVDLAVRADRTDQNHMRRPDDQVIAWSPEARECPDPAKLQSAPSATSSVTAHLSPWISATTASASAASSRQWARASSEPPWASAQRYGYSRLILGRCIARTRSATMSMGDHAASLVDDALKPAFGLSHSNQ